MGLEKIFKVVSLSLTDQRAGIDRREASQTIKNNNFLFRCLRKFPFYMQA